MIAERSRLKSYRDTYFTLLKGNLMDLNDVFTGASLKAQDLKGQEVTVTIAKYEVVDFDDGKKLVLSFQESDRTLICNKTNGSTIGDLHGTNLDAWMGKKITLFPTQTDFGGKQVPCIRVKLAPPPAAERQPLPGNPQRPPADGYGNDSPF